MTNKRGSIRHRGRDAWELRVCRGVDPYTGRRLIRDPHRARQHRTAQRQLEALVVEVENAATHEGTLAELLKRWTAASPEWKPSTQATVRWATRCHLVPHLGHLPVAKLTAVDIDDFYAFLLRAVADGGDPRRASQPADGAALARHRPGPGHGGVHQGAGHRTARTGTDRNEDRLHLPGRPRPRDLEGAGRLARGGPRTRPRGGYEVAGRGVRVHRQVRRARAPQSELGDCQTSRRHDVPAGCHISGCTIFATSWRPRCSPPRCLWPPSPPG